MFPAGAQRFDDCRFLFRNHGGWKVGKVLNLRKELSSQASVLSANSCQERRQSGRALGSCCGVIASLGSGSVMSLGFSLYYHKKGRNRWHSKTCLKTNQKNNYLCEHNNAESIWVWAAGYWLCDPAGKLNTYIIIIFTIWAGRVLESLDTILMFYRWSDQGRACILMVESWPGMHRTWVLTQHHRTHT